MTLTTRLRRSVSLAAITAVAGTAALAGTASAATFEKAPVLQPGATIPVDFPGYKEPANNKLKATTASSSSAPTSLAASGPRRSSRRPRASRS